MCGIIGIFNEKNAFSKIKLGLKLLQPRGKDGCGIASAKILNLGKELKQISKIFASSLVGHTLHSIVGYVPQPIKNKGILVANCEIYNWKELSEKYHFNVKNDAELLLHFLDKFGVSSDSLEQLDGVYAFAYWYGQNVYLARDILGVKPLWYAKRGLTQSGKTKKNEKNKKAFAFSSERKVLEQLSYSNVIELNPRHILKYTIKNSKINDIYKIFFSYLPEHQESKEEIKKKLNNFLNKAIQKRIPEQKVGLLFSGGIDSTFIAHYLKQNSCNFTCYLTVLDSADLNSEQIPSDLIYAEKAAKQLGLKLKIRRVTLSELQKALPKIVNLIEDTNVTKVSVALTLYFACEMANKDGCKVIFSGLGSEEIFAGYERHKYSSNLNQECISGLIKLYERDLYRDDVITMYNGLELRLPFLDKKLVEYSLKILSKYKMNEEHSKLILREIALEQGISPELAFRKKVAAQYGSRIDWALDKLSKKDGFASRSAYLRKFYPKPNLKLGVLFSSGKDSTYAALIMQRQNYELSCLITIKSMNKESYMFHTPAIDLAKLQAHAMGLPLIMHATKGEKEIELKDLKKALKEAKQKYHIDGIVTGAIFSTYQRDRIEKVCDELGLKIFSPLWHKPQEMEMMELLSSGFKFILTSIAAEGLDKSWLGREITKVDVDKLKQLRERLGTNVAGEGGEFESLVLDCPLFKKRLEIIAVGKLMDSSCSGRLIIKKAKLVVKA